MGGVPVEAVEEDGLCRIRSVEYDVNLESDGCYKAQSPPTFIGGPTMQAGGGSVTYPLFIVYGCFDTL